MGGKVKSIEVRGCDGVGGAEDFRELGGFGEM